MSAAVDSPPPLTPYAAAMSRAERRKAKARYARELRDQDSNITYDAIAAFIVHRFGGTCTAKTVRDYLWDPDGKKAAGRKESYRGTCSECGKPTSGGDGPGAAKELCQSCKHTRPGSKARKHDKDSVKAALRRWYRQEGQWPTSYDLTRYWAAKRGPEAVERIERYDISARVVSYQFGTFKAGLEAAQQDEAASVPLSGPADRHRAA